MNKLFQSLTSTVTNALSAANMNNNNQNTNPYAGVGGGYAPPYGNQQQNQSQPAYYNQPQQQPGYPGGGNVGFSPYPSGPSGGGGMPQPYQYNNNQPSVGFNAPSTGSMPSGYPPMNNNMPYPPNNSGAGYPPSNLPYGNNSANPYPNSSTSMPPYGNFPDSNAARYQPYGSQPPYGSMPSAPAFSNNSMPYCPPQQQQYSRNVPPHSGSSYPPPPSNVPQPAYQPPTQPTAPTGHMYPNLSASQAQYSTTGAAAGNFQFEPTIRPTPGFHAQTDAEKLYKAMKGFGTDEKALIRVLCCRTWDERHAIVRAFKQMYGKDLIHSLQSELSGNFEKLMVSLCTAPDVYDAMSIRKAVEGMGTDEDSLVEILCSRSNREIHLMQAAYKQVFGRSTEHDIKGDTSGWFARLMISLLTADRDESGQVDVNRARQTAQELYSRGEKRWGTDEAYFNSVMAAQSYGQLRCVFDEYQRLTGHSMEQAIMAEMSGDVRNGMLAIIKCVRNPSVFFAEQLYKSMKGIGTRDHVLIRVLITRCEKDLGSIKRVFQQMHGQSLEQFIKGDTSGDYERGLLALCGVVP